MNINANSRVHDWDKDTSREELLARLAQLKHRTAQSLPILDDDDLEEAVEEAADRLTPE